MTKLDRVTSRVVCFTAENINTDQIIPARFLKRIDKTGFGNDLFADMKPPEVFGLSGARQRQIMLCGPNFGCGSSREHAVWAIDEYGFRCVIAPSFADIFFSNCFNNGVLPVVLEPHDVDAIFDMVARDSDAPVTVDLPAQHVRLPDGQAFVFEIDPARKEKLIKGLDSIGETLQHADAIRDYEQKRAAEAPWLFKSN
jgi:3-isopropylmalate/(R)-2-methylmalate dehydratase small subunit